ncbi:hypothetical protein ANRL2_01959 [Anaerolineae bacterium]|nr:hypothetical protein ANRL2_01959 [Anaerolineae bacterium]
MPYPDGVKLNILNGARLLAIHAFPANEAAPRDTHGASNRMASWNAKEKQARLLRVELDIPRGFLVADLDPRFGLGGRVFGHFAVSVEIVVVWGVVRFDLG